MKKYSIFVLISLTVVGGMFYPHSSFGQQIISSNLNDTTQVNGTGISVKYDITGGKLVSIKAYTVSDSLVISLQTTGSGNFIINLPRTLIDAKQNGDDTHFAVKVNNQGTSYEEISTDTNRILEIPLHNGAEKIQIIGTQMFAQIPSIEGSSAQNSTLSSNPTQVLEAPVTHTPPIIDGKWNTLEGNQSKAVSAERNGAKMYILAQHDSNFLYLIADIVTDQTTPSYAPLMGYDLLMIFDTGSYDRGFLGSGEIGLGTSYTFLNGTRINTSFGSQVWTYDNQSKPVDLVTPTGYNSTIGFSSTNDPFESGHDHRLYEFRIPLSLLHNSDRYGFSLKASACSGYNTSACRPLYTIFWPSGTIMSVPSSHGTLELIGNSPQSATAISKDLGLITGGIMSAAAIAVFVTRYRNKRLIKLK